MTPDFQSVNNNNIKGAGLILILNNKILLVRTRIGNRGWGPPKGHVEKEDDDSFWNCMLRETREETGYDFTDLLDESEAKSIIIHYTSKCNYKFFIVIKNDSNFELPIQNNIESQDEVSQAKWFDYFDFDFAINNNTKNKRKSKNKKKEMLQRITIQCFKALKRKKFVNYYFTSGIFVPIFTPPPVQKKLKCSYEQTKIETGNMFSLLNEIKI